MKKFNETAQFLKDNGITAPEIGIILGTGLGGFIKEMRIEKEISYDKIPNFPVSTAESHKGNLIYGSLHGKKIIAMQGRFHLYEGYSLQEVVFPVRVMKLLGIRYLLVSNAAGAVNLSYDKGDLMLLDDHINLQGGSPLTGANYDSLGVRFPDMSRPYSTELNTIFKDIAKEKAITLREGVYAAVSGPQLETRAEYRFIRIIGADAVGMSTVPEVITAHQMRLPCAAISVITDIGDPDNLHEVSVAEIIAVAEKAEKKLIVLFSEMVRRL